ncbi:hypothetical protein ES319_D07G027800v1 [Gossypium barbadense]|uniref:Uncharacterized protein n=2 Tax=Gossypium TaxID=3633 RepID=A0A5J5QN85_GOSBA|nr:hypothetical protein ES319_D07G027800v1 [Gossypium barbadense]TYG59972.1 hypothetical protein ES288_D07G029500v1 [Gossypium darwinii]
MMEPNCILNGDIFRLKELALRMLNGFNRLTIDEGAFPSLEWLSIGPSPYLEELPWTISCLNSLKHLALHNMPVPHSFARRLVPNEGTDHWNVKHTKCCLLLHQWINAILCLQTLRPAPVATPRFVVFHARYYLFIYGNLC